MLKLSFVYTVALFVSVYLHCCTANIVWTPDKPRSNANLLGSARYIDASTIQLTTNKDQVGAVWWTTAQTITNGFEMTIDFKVGPNNAPRTYFAFVIQGSNDSIIAASDKMGGYDFKNNLAIEVGISHIGVYGTNPTLVNSNASIIVKEFDSEDTDDYINGGLRTLIVIYDHRAKKIYAKEDSDDYRVDKELYIPDYVNLIGGKKAYIGFTQASGSRTNFVQLNISNLIFTNNAEKGCDVNNCSKFAICTSVGEGYYCNCSQGTVGNGTYCEVQVPGIPDTPQVNMKGADFLNLTWNPVPAKTYPISGYHIQCFNDTSTQVLFTIPTNNVTSYVITNLTAMSHYRCRVRAYDTMTNIGEWSQNATLQTNAERPQQPAVRCFMNGTTLIANWTQVPKASYDIANYTVYFRSPGSSEQIYKGPDDFTLIFSDLTPSAKYYVFVSVFDVKGLHSGNGSAECIIPDAPGTPPPNTPPPNTPPPSTPPPLVPPSLVSFDIVRNYTENNRFVVEFYWNFAPGTNTVVKYLFNVTYENTTTIISQSNPSSGTFSSFVPGVPHTFSIIAEDSTGLQSSPQYKAITIQAQEIPACKVCHADATCYLLNDVYDCTCNANSYGDGIICGSCIDSTNCTTGFDCNTKTYSCEAQPPGIPLNVANISQGIDFVRLSWTAVPATAYPITNYTVRCLHEAENFFYITTPNVTSYLISNLNPNTHYTCQVRAQDALLAYSQWSSSESFYTDAIRLPSPESFIIERNYTLYGRAVVDFSWKFSNGTYSIAYYLFTVADGNSTITDDITETNFTFSTFIPGVLYTFSIAAVDTTGLLSESFELSFAKQASDILACASCHPNASCLLTANTYECACNDGFYGNGKTCGTCANSSFCSSGFLCNTTTYTCEDIDECANASACEEGYRCQNFDGYRACLDINECANKSRCAVGFNCINSYGSYTCQDINECENETICDMGFYCNNTLGSYTCEKQQIVSLTPRIYNFSDTSDGSIDILIGWEPASPACRDCCIYYVLELSVNNLEEFRVVYNGTDLNKTYEFYTLPRTYSFRVRCFTASGEASDYSTIIHINSPGCPDLICNREIGENATNCPQDCADQQPHCPGCINGSCQNGVCMCFTEFSGPNCTLHVVDSTMYMTARNASIPEIHATVDSMEFQIEVLNITEMDEYNQKSNKSYTLSEEITQYEYINETDVSFSYLLPNGATLIVYAKLYHHADNISFAQQNISIVPNSIKISLTVRNWDFQKIKNSLQISMRSGSANFSACNDAPQYGSGEQWSEMSSGAYTLFGKFAKNALIDGRAAKVTTRFENEVAIMEIPHFWQEAVLDPDYSVLTREFSENMSPDTYCRTNKTNKIGIYVGVSIAAVVGVLAIVVGGHLAFTRQRKAEFEGMMKRGQVRLSAMKGD